MNNNPDNLNIKVHHISPDGTVKSVQYEFDVLTLQIESKSEIPSEMNTFQPNYTWDSDTDCKVNLNCHYIEQNESSITVIKLGGIEDLHPMNYANEISTVLNDSVDSKSFFSLKPKRESKIPNIPTMVRCQNCDTNFPTKYQYQRHQCEFNAEKVVLKPDADIKDIEKGVRIKYDCNICGKQFVSKNNLERHQTSHDNVKENVCEHCNKQFVSENRLRIHKENHCKKAGDISKFYRSDVAVWKCLKCNQVFATPASANRHSDGCTEIPPIIIEDNEEQKAEENLSEGAQNGDTKTDKQLNENKNVEKVLTELLLQCEFCNRTYAEKSLLLQHQKKHTTEVNYECITCKEVFDSYTLAAKHWLTKCSDEANLFYLPKLTYCEYCDRTFKSHEILYTHKIKKKHYTAKIHIPKGTDVDNSNEKSSDDKDVIVKLIQDVFTTLDVPLMKFPENKTTPKNNDENKENIEPNNGQDVTIKNEMLNQKMDVSMEVSDEPEKKKRGRKRKWPKQNTKAKRMAATVEEGYKYQCEKCIKVWNSVMELESHREKEHAANFTCDDCGQVLHSAKALVIHSRAHQSLKPYVCETCGRSYSQTSHLWQHMRFHQGIKPFACPHEGCEARYTIRPDLKDHIRKVHTRERPFKCAVCNKCFLTGSVYYQHRLIHTNDRRYGCDICQKRFFRADALNNHRRIHTNERPYPCHICGREFRQKGDRNKHVRTQHPE